MQLPVTMRTRPSAFALALLAGTIALLAACRGGDSTSPPGAPPPPPPPPPDVWNTVAQRSWSVPSQTEAYVCHVELVASDKYITGFRLSSPSAAQTEVYLLARPSATQTGDYDCSESEFLGGEAIYLAGPGTTPLTFSGGKGVHVVAGQYLMLITHINNTTASGVTASTVIEGRVGAAKDVTTPIDMFFGGRVNFQLPSGIDTVTSNSKCNASTEFHLVAELTLMRALGTHTVVTITDTGLDTALVDVGFDPKHIVYSTLSSDFDVPADARFNTSCTFVKDANVVVNLGESANDELCFSGNYRYPPKPPTSMSPIECALGDEI